MEIEQGTNYCKIITSLGVIEIKDNMLDVSTERKYTRITLVPDKNSSINAPKCIDFKEVKNINNVQ